MCQLLEAIEIAKMIPFNEFHPFYDADENDLFSTYEGDSYKDFEVKSIYICRLHPSSHPPLAGIGAVMRLWRLSVMHDYCLGEEV
jgi:hypothetical protein